MSRTFLIFLLTLVLAPELAAGKGKPALLKILLFSGRASSLTMEKNNITIKGNRIQISRRSLPFHAPEKIINSTDYIILKGYKYSGRFLFKKGKTTVQIINVLDLEQYLPGVLAAEISSSWPAEAIKAQAVAARSYAYYLYLLNKDKSFHINATTLNQVYSGNSRKHPKLKAAVKATRGIILLYRNRPIQTFFTASCGGQTEKAKNVWNARQDCPYLQHVRCHYCISHPKYSWQFKIRLGFIGQKLAAVVKPKAKITRLRVKKVSSAGRIKTISIYTTKGIIEIPGNKFRMLLGSRNLPSLLVKLRQQGESVLFTGKGYGHGVGLCQWGAKTMAEKGWGFRSILEYYYKSITFKRIY